jgi:hypothetical protein
MARPLSSFYDRDLKEGDVIHSSHSAGDKTNSLRSIKIRRRVREQRLKVVKHCWLPTIEAIMVSKSLSCSEHASPNASGGTTPSTRSIVKTQEMVSNALLVHRKSAFGYLQQLYSGLDKALGTLRHRSASPY